MGCFKGRQILAVWGRLSKLGGGYLTVNGKKLKKAIMTKVIGGGGGLRSGGIKILEPLLIDAYQKGGV